MNRQQFEQSVHKYGRIWMFTALALILFVPTFLCIYFDAWPNPQDVFVGLLGVAPIFWTVAVIEVLTYIPMLGAGGSYLGFVTGNLTNLKLPCALSAMESAKVEAGSEEGELISTISIAVSSITTTIVIAIGVLLLAQIEPLLQAEILQPAFSNILPALFGGLAVVFIAKDPKIAFAPIVFMITLFALVPSLAGSVGVLVPVGSIIAIFVARILYKKGKL